MNRRKPSFAPTTSSYLPDVGGSSCPVQRTLKSSPANACAFDSSPRAARSSVGAPRSQRNAMRESTRVITGAPAKSRPRKYSPFSPCCVEPGFGSQEVRLDERHGSRLFAPFDQIRAARIKHFRLRPDGFANSLQNRHRRRRRAVVVSEQRHDFVRRRADDRQCLDVARQRQHAVVLQHHDRGLRRTPRQLIVLRAIGSPSTESAPSARARADRTCRAGSASASDGAPTHRSRLR